VTDIYVFGSIVKNSYNEKSDIDIAVIVEKNLSTKQKINLEKAGEEIESRFKREIQLHLFTNAEFKRASGLAEQVQRDGIKLI